MRRACLLLAAQLLGAQSDGLDEYLTHLARQCWDARRAELARIRTPEQVRARQRYIRERMTAEIGGFPEKTPLNARITGRLARDGYSVEKLIYESRPGFFVTANVYVPASVKPPYAAVLGVAGHTTGGKADATYQHAWIGMVKRGFLVLAFDPPGQGERIVHMGGTTEHTMMGVQCLLTGANFAQYEIWDGIRAVDYLIARGDVDPRRIAAAGNSGGGTQSSYLAVFEPRLAVAAPSCYITSWEKLWAGQGPQDAEQDFAGFLKDGFDFGDFLIAFAPRPIQMSTAVQDFFPIDGARSTYAEVRRIYEVMDAPGRAGYFEFDDQHGWSKPRREATYRWLEQWLHDRTTDGAEGDLAVEDEKTLWVTPDGKVGGESVQSLNAKYAATLAPKGGLTAERIARVLAVPARSGTPELRDVPVRVHGGGARGPATLVVADDTTESAGQVTMSVEPHGWRVAPKQAFSTAMRAALVGRTLLGIQVYDVLRAFDALAARPDVDPRRIKLRGRGNAAVVALLAAALEPRIAAVELSGGPASYREIVQSATHQGVDALVVPGVLREFDLPDVARMVQARLLK